MGQFGQFGFGDGEIFPIVIIALKIALLVWGARDAKNVRIAELPEKPFDVPAGTPRRRGSGDGRRVPEPGAQVTARLYIRAIRGYQRFGSPVLSTFEHCRYRPTCSAYSIEAVRIHGIRAVLVLAVKRIASCMPSVPPGTADPVPLAFFNNELGCGVLAVDPSHRIQLSQLEERMPFCASCGSAVEGRFCPKCGAAMGAPAAAAGGTGAGTGYTPPPPQAASGPAASAPAAAGMQDNVASALCYLFGLITGVLFLVLAPYNQNKAIRFHAFQSIFWHIAWIVIWIVYGIVRVALAFVLPLSLSLVLTLLSLVVWFGGFLSWLFLMWKAYNNEKFVIPIIGPLAEKQA